MPAETRDPILPADGSASTGWERLPAGYGIPKDTPSLRDSQAFCRRLATSHYENFPVVTWFLPRHLHQHFFNVYAYCRISDDIGDEVGNAALSFRMFDEWEAELNACYEGTPRHPVFVALRETVREFAIPKQEFTDLLIAFRQDQTVTRFPRFEDVLHYCRYSANPVGHLVLYLCGYSDPERQKLADYTCTALQLANFWQDVAVDFRKGRIYLPLEDMERFGVAEAELEARRATPQFLKLMQFEVQRARDWFDRGLPLVKMVDKHLAIDLKLFTRGGQEILRAIEGQRFDVLKKRPAISKAGKLWLVLRAGMEKLA